MLFNKKKIREFANQLDEKKLPKDVQEVVREIENTAPSLPHAGFQKQLRQKLLMQHKNMKHSQKEAVKPAGKPQKSFSGGIGFRWSYAVSFVALVLVAAVASYPLIPAPTVEGYTLRENVRKISYNAPIKVVFSQPMDHGSVESAFHVEPRVAGKTEWSGNTLLFYPDEAFKVGDTYEVYVEKSAKSILQKSMAYDYEETFQIAGPPQVILFHPGSDSEEVAVDSKITVMFDRPMTALKSLDEGTADVPDLTIEPAVTGRYRWLGTNSISFIPDKLDYATTYTITVPKGTEMADGGKTDEDFVSRFTTLKPVFVSSTPYDKDLYSGPTTTVRLDFNQPMNMTRAKEFIHLYALKDGSADQSTRRKIFERGGAELTQNFSESLWKPVDFGVRTLTKDDVKAQDAFYGYYEEGMAVSEPETDESALANSLVLVPASPLDFQEVYLVKIDKDYGGAEGTYGLPATYGVVFSTVGEVSVINSNPKNGVNMETDVNPDTGRRYAGSVNWASINFSSPLDREQKLEDFLSISPEQTDPDTKEPVKPTLTPDYDGTGISIMYNFKPSTDYTITVKAGLKDRFGQTMKQDYALKFRTAALEPRFDLMNSSDIDVIDRYNTPEYFIRTTNLDTLDFNFKKLSDEEFQALYSRGYVNYYVSQAVSGPFISWTKKVEKKFNEKVTNRLDLNKELGEALTPSIYYFDVSSPDVLDYTGNRYVQRQIFMLTGTSLAVKSSRDSILVWATSMKDGAPVSGVDVSLRSSAGKDVAAKTTDKDGLVSFDVASLNKNIENGAGYEYTVIGTRGDDTTMTHTSWSDGIAPWNFNIDFDSHPPETFLYGYTDRPIYRPGHTVYFKGLVRKDRDGKFSLPDKQKVHVEISDSQGEKVYEKDLDLNSNGAFTGELTLGAQARVGGYTMIFTLPDLPGYGNSGFTSFKVAEYRKPDYELKVDSDKDDYVNGETAKITAEGAYFFGAPLPDAPLNWTVKIQDYYFFIPYDSKSPYASQWYSFSDEGYLCYWGCEGKMDVLSSGATTLDANGHYTLDLPLNISEKKMSQFYTVEFTAHDLNNQTVSNRTTVPVHAGEYYMGILNQDYVVESGKPVNFDVISVDFEGMPVSGKQAEVSLYKRSWNTVKKKNVDGGFYYENSYEDTLVEKKSVTTDGQGYAQATFSPRDGGSFKAAVTSLDTRGNTIAASTTVYVTSDTYVNWGRENNDKMELIADKLEYKPGETAHILVKSPYRDVWALVTEERQNVVSRRVMKIDSNSQTIDIPLTDNSIPNVFVSVLVMKGDQNQAGLSEPPVGANDERGVAAFKLGYTTLQVDNSSKKLTIDVSSDKATYKPGEEVKLKVRTTDAQGVPTAAEVSVSVVDKSVLSLVENVTADLLNAFYRKRMLSVSTAVTLTKALSRVNVQVEAGLKGGGGADKSKRGIFKDTAHWEAALQTDANGNGEITFKLPDNLTTWQVLAIGITKDTLVGSQKYEFLVNKDVIVRPVIPRFFIVNDATRLAAIVHNYTDKERTFAVSIETDDGLKLTGGSAVQSVNVKSGEEVKVEWNVLVKNEEETTLTFRATASDDQNVADAIEQKLPIHPYSFPEVVATSLTINDADKHVENVWLPVGIDPNFGQLTVSVSPTLTASIADGLDYLMTFPYGCVEQTASALLPNLVLKQVLDLPTVKDDLVDLKELQKNVDTGLQTIYKYQQANGGWGLWDTSQPTPYLTAYVLNTLNEAKKAGYSVDDNVISRGVGFLKNHMSEHSLAKPADNAPFAEKQDNRMQSNIRAYALFVLAEMGQGDMGLTNNLYDFRDQLNTFSKAYHVMTLNRLLDDGGLDGSVQSDLTTKIDSLKTSILNTAKETPRGVHFEDMDKLYALFDTDTRTTALVLQMLTRIEPNHPYIPKILRFMLMEKKDGHYATTQETAVSLLALVEYLTASGELEASYNGIVTLNGAEHLNKPYSQKNIADQDVLTFALTELSPNNQDNEITFTMNGVGRMYADMNLKYYLPTEQIEPRDEGLVVTQEYFALDDETMEKSLKSVKVGENLKAKMTVIVPENRYYVMVEDFLPAGLEGIDFSLATSEQQLRDNEKPLNADPYSYYWGSPFNYSEVRDDRVMYFADYLPKGVYEIEYFVRATTPGTYHDLPALAQEWYFPEVFGRSAGQIFQVIP